MLKHIWKFTLPMTIIIIFGLGIGGYALICATDFQYRFGLRVKSDTIEIDTEIKKGAIK